MQKISIIVFVLLFSFTACDKNLCNNDLKEGDAFKIMQGPCGKIVFKNNIGNNYNMALDSLVKIKEPFLNGLNTTEYYIESNTIVVEFFEDERFFFNVSFLCTNSGIPIFSTSDVLDSYGNYYLIHWCED